MSSCIQYAVPDANEFCMNTISSQAGSESLTLLRDLNDCSAWWGCGAGWWGWRRKCDRSQGQGRHVEGAAACDGVVDAPAVRRHEGVLHEY